MRSFSFIKSRKYFYTIALSLIAISLLAPFIFGTRLGIDMTGWLQIEYTCDTSICDVSTVKTAAETVKSTILHEGKGVMNDVNVYKVVGEEKIVVEWGFSQGNISDAEIENLKTTFKDSLTSSLSAYSLSRHVNIGESFGSYIKRSGYMTLAITILMISLYIQYAFRGSIQGMASWPFAVVTGLSLAHDVVIAFWLYVITGFFFPEFKIDTFFLTAMLTILGYSINDTIVVMDRIRSNLKEKAAAKNGLGPLIDTAINDTLRRSLFTSLTILIVLVAMFFFGPDSIRGFTLALLYGTIVGTYSSVCIAAPLLYDITTRHHTSK